MRMALAVLLALASLSRAGAEDQPMKRKVPLRDMTTVEGIRSNSLLGYGMVIGLNGTGDRSQTIFTTQTLSALLQRMGVQTPPTTMMVKNVAAVIVTATLPPFAVHGSALDVTVSSIGDAKSLDGGTLLLTPLYGPDGEVYAAAQGSLTVGGYSASSGGTSKQVNHPTVGTISGGARVERDVALDLDRLDHIALLLRQPGFRAAQNAADAIDQAIGMKISRAVNSRKIELRLPAHTSAAELLAKIEMIEIESQPSAKIVVSERTGTVVMGGDVRLGVASIFHGNLSIQVEHSTAVSQPPPLSGGSTVESPINSVQAQEAPARLIELQAGASVAQLVEALQKIGATARDVVAILQAMKAAGAIEADMEVL